MQLSDGKFKLTKRSGTFVAVMALVFIGAGLAGSIADRNVAITATVRVQAPDGIEDRLLLAFRLATPRTIHRACSDAPS